MLRPVSSAGASLRSLASRQARACASATMSARAFSLSASSSFTGLLSSSPSTSFSLSSTYLSSKTNRFFSTSPFVSSLVNKKFKYLSITQKDSALWISLNRPDIHNAFDEELIQEIKTAFTEVTKEQKEQKDAHLRVRSVVLAGEGASFSAGADLNWMAKMAKYSMDENEADSRELFDMFAAIKFCPIPVIARVNGAAMGGGTGLISACDMSFAVESAKLGFTECALGLIPAVISRFVIEKIGKSNASMYFLTAERFSAQEACRIGLVSAVFPTMEAVDARIAEVTKTISKNSPAAVKEAKKLIDDASVDKMQLSAPDTRSFLAKKIAFVRSSEEGKAGVRAFLDKKKPFWLNK